MPFPLRDVLRHPSLAAAEPVVRSGRTRLARLVHWVHTSELLDIAPLLRGGELLLVGGLTLAPASSAQRRAYIRDLAAAHVAGLAVELGPQLPALPEEMVVEADDRGLPLIELRRVVRFVEVTQQVNGLLTNKSVRRLQLADRVSHALAASLADGAGVDDLVRVLAEVSAADTRLTSLAGEIICEALAQPEDGESGGHRGLRRAGPEEAVVSAVTSGGITVAMLSLTPTSGSDPLLVDAASDRAPEAIGLALLRSRPLSGLERDAHDFLTLAIGNHRMGRTFTGLARRLGLNGRGSYVGVTARFELHPKVAASIEAALRRRGRASVSQLRNGIFMAVVGMPPSTGRVAQHRRTLLEDLREVPFPADVRLSVGSSVRILTDIPRSLTVARACLEQDGWGATADVVLDCVDLAVPRLVHDVSNEQIVSRFVHELLGELLEHDRRRGTRLFETLTVYLRHSGSKTDSARALHLQRQSLYQRLGKIFELLGNPTPGTPEYGALTVAVELEAARRMAQDAH
jgi:purine catabolism regulator